MKSTLKKFFFSHKFTRLWLYRFLPKFKQYPILINSTKLDSDSVFLDFGGNVGLVSQYIDDKIGCKIHIYEPHPGCQEVLRKKFRGRQNIIINSFAISKENGEAKFYFHEESKNELDISKSQGASLDDTKSNVSTEKYITVKTVNVNEILESFNFIDMLKIDIEGEEYSIFQDIIDNRHKFGKIFCEMHQRNAEQKNKYKFWKNKLIEEGLYGNTFVEWH